jgi:predicted Rossmann fold flavoprotein
MNGLSDDAAQWQTVVVGAGAAGLLAATRSAELGRRTLLLEKNGRAGVKILMSGGTRCNVTHATDRQGIAGAFGRRQGSFLRSALAGFGPDDIVGLLHGEGVATKVEPTGKIFPVSNRARDVLEALLRRLLRSGARLALSEPLVAVDPTASGFLLSTACRILNAQRIVLTTGGASYPGCGTTGDGYAWARQLGHSVVPPRPALVPITTTAPWVAPLRGITLADVSVHVIRRQGQTALTLDHQRGSLLFTHFGLSGPAILNASRTVTQGPVTGLSIECDLAPELTEAQLGEWLKDQLAREGKRQVSTILAERIPVRLAETLARLAEIPEGQRAAELSRAGRLRLVQLLKGLPIPVKGTMGFKKAEVTAGGVVLDEVASRTMESKRVPGCYFAGEILDLDGPIGGYNFQAAFSTGWLAGSR